MRNAGLTALTSLLERNAPVSPALRRILESGYIRILDTKAIVEDPPAEHIDARLTQEKGKGHLASHFATTAVMEEEIRGVHTEGLGVHLHTLMACFGSILLEMIASTNQKRAVLEWTFGGRGAGCFLMTDPGGPDVNSWSTRTLSERDERLLVNKIYAIIPANVSFAIILARGTGGLAPVYYLIPPTEFSTLKRTRAGMPWLDGNVQLENISGEISATKEWQLKAGGIGTMRTFWSICRPRIVCSFVAHLNWLRMQGRIEPPSILEESISNLKILADAVLAKSGGDRFYPAECMALKFTSNEVILQAAIESRRLSSADRRDLLAFTKMEGSSYRCFNEISAMLGMARR